MVGWAVTELGSLTAVRLQGPEQQDQLGGSEHQMVGGSNPKEGKPEVLFQPSGVREGPGMQGRMVGGQQGNWSVSIIQGSRVAPVRILILLSGSRPEL